MGRRAVVVGAGIGGLATGRALRSAGFEVRILERSTNPEPAGAGISLWPNAVHVLRDLGVDANLPATGPLKADSGLRRWNGRIIAITDLAEIERRHGAPLLLLQRTTLHAALLADGIADLVETGTEVVGAVESGAAVRVELSESETVEADLVIGADGIHSSVRTALLNDGAPRHSGLRAYRAIVDRLPVDVGQGEYWGAGGVFGLVPVDGGRLYWFATRRVSPGEPGEENPIPALRERHQGWAPGILEAIDATSPTAVLQHDLLDRAPVNRWVSDRIALLGDAAHPMLPFLGQGACQALEDAQILGGTLRAEADIPAALAAYNVERRRRAARIVKLSRRMGQLAHLGSAPLRTLRDRAMAMTPDRVRLRQLDAIVGRAS